VSGLTNGTAYTFTVTATSAAGSGPASTPASPVTPFTVPGAATGVSAVAGNASATVSFAPPASNGGATIGSYTVTAYPGGASATGAGSPIVIGGLANGTAYAFTVTATNTAGSGATSDPSSPVTPNAPRSRAKHVTPTPKPDVVVVINQTIGPVSIDMTETEVEQLIGEPSSTLTLSFGHGRHGRLARYTLHGGLYLVTYDAAGRVVSIQAASSYWHTAGGVGPGSSLSRAAALHGFRVDYCEYGYWNGSAHTAPGAPVTIFVPGSTTVASVLITVLSYNTDCEAPPQLAPVPEPGAVVLNHSIGGVSIGMTEAAVNKLLGHAPTSTVRLTLGGGKSGHYARYRSHGGAFLVTYNSTGHVLSIEAYAPFYRTDGGLGVGPGSSLGAAATLRGFRVDYCEFGYWNGSARTAPNQVVTIFTPNSGEVASVLITEYRFYTACHSGPTSVAPPS
jgi:YD repeat-containing protein